MMISPCFLLDHNTIVAHIMSRVACEFALDIDIHAPGFRA